MSTPHTSHIDVDTLADLGEGLLEADQVTSVAEHLDRCAECRARRDALDDVQLLLRDLGAGADAPAPDDVVRRLDDALAAAATPLPTASATVTPLTALTTRVRQPWRTRVLQAAAVFVLVAAVGGLGYGGIRAVSGGNSTGTTGAADSGGSAATEKHSAAHRYVVTSSGRNYTEESQRSAVPGLLSGKYDATAQGSGGVAVPSKTPTGAQVPAAGSVADPQRLRDGKALAACVANLADGPVTPLAVDIARFDGKPATIIVLPDPKDPSIVYAYAVAPDCAEGTFLAALPVTLP
jgi:negative regulator of sigma E activity